MIFDSGVTMIKSNAMVFISLTETFKELHQRLHL